MKKLLIALESVSVSSGINKTMLNFIKLDGLADVTEDQFDLIKETFNLDVFFNADKNRTFGEFRTLVENLAKKEDDMIVEPYLITMSIAKLVLVLKKLKNRYNVPIFTCLETELIMKGTIENAVIDGQDNYEEPEEVETKGDEPVEEEEKGDEIVDEVKTEGADDDTPESEEAKGEGDEDTPEEVKTEGDDNGNDGAGAPEAETKNEGEGDEDTPEEVKTEDEKSDGDDTKTDEKVEDKK